jgi:signal transduction histidine kinase/CheY-like chemotaxis protein
MESPIRSQVRSEAPSEARAQTNSPAATSGVAGRYDTERAQAIVRVSIVAGWAIYTIWSLAEHQISTRYTLFFTVLFAIVGAASGLLLFSIIRWPGTNHSRRVLGMVHDYAAMTIAMIFGGEAYLPVYSVILWVTVGNGMRYGPRYLIASTALALASIGVTALTTPYWQQQPYVMATMVLTTLIIPAYAHQLLTRLHLAYDAALEANLAKSRFLAQASHDLRQPIHAMSLFTACLRDTGLVDEQQQMVDNIDKSLRSVAGLFRSLLDLSTLDSGGVKPKMETVALADVLQDVVGQNSEAARWAGVTLTVVPTTRYILIDPRLLATMIQNIVSNAVKYAPGRPVLIGCRRKGKTLSVEVHDRGNGISEQHLSRLFEEFYQVRALGDKDIEGVGLGLSIVRRMSQLMDLNVSIRSRIGKGTVVAIEGLRIAAAPPTKPVQIGLTTMLHGLNVLLVEDDDPALLAAATLLERWGCVVQRRSSVPDGPVDCDLIITDFDLGSGMTGSECIARIRHLAGRKIPAIVMTGHDATKVRDDLAEPEIPILSKPVRPAELRSAVATQKLRIERQQREL